jgi:GDP-L-fucose synthase
MNKFSKVLITGASGMVGISLVNVLQKKGYKNLLTPSAKELNLKNQKDVDIYFKKNKIDYVFHLAAKVGGIATNIASPGEFMYDNLIMECNIIESSKNNGIRKLLFLGSSCIYPKNSKQPMKEEYLLDGKLEPTNEGYALAKIAGLKLCEYYNKQYGTNFISLMPCNIYGVNDHFNLKNSHVISALITKFHNAKKNKLPFVEVWGTGNARREFLYVEDIANAMVYFMEKYNAKDLPSFINIGVGEDISIKDLSNLIKETVGYRGDIKFNTSKPDGMKKKLLDISLAKKFGWKNKIDLKNGLKLTYNWYTKVFLNEKN